MDNLARNAMLARQANMTYGKWKALQYQEQPKPEKKSDLPEGWLRCEWCNTPFKPKTKRKQMFCQAYCQQRACYERNHEKKIERMRRYREKKKLASVGE